MHLLKVVLLFVCLIYGTSARDFFENLDPYFRRLIEASRGIINRECKNILESQRDNFKTGWPVVGIKPLDPVYIDRFEIPLGTTNLTLLNAELSGISDFTIDNCDLKVLGLYAAISMYFDQLTIDGNHETKTKLGLINYQGSGDAEITFTGVSVTVEILLGVKGENQLNLDEFNFDIHVEKVVTHLTGFGLDAIDKAISAGLNETLRLAVNVGDVFFEALFAAFVYPVNAFLNRITLPQLIADIIAFIQRYNS
ncbi:uncharacterized protein LOC119077509 [Bradysia coprophila]|uniref:uncharacterized protein LOC119077509 n=1 Tax=Bradysia coprophila TaxID=38358 RepID=UPI00187DB0C4|nr:uncharacterized protein LOC119077509 [Bradysia coprophila]